MLIRCHSNKVCHNFYFYSSLDYYLSAPPSTNTIWFASKQSQSMALVAETFHHLSASPSTNPFFHVALSDLQLELGNPESSDSDNPNSFHFIFAEYGSMMYDTTLALFLQYYCCCIIQKSSFAVNPSIPEWVFVCNPQCVLPCFSGFPGSICWLS